MTRPSIKLFGIACALVLTLRLITTYVFNAATALRRTSLTQIFADVDRKSANFSESIVISGTEIFEKPDNTLGRPRRRSLNIASFSSSANFLVVVTDGSPVRGNQTWMLSSNVDFLLARDCANLTVALRSRSESADAGGRSGAAWRLTSDAAWRADILLANHRLIDSMAFRADDLSTSQSEDLGQRLRIAHIYHHYDVHPLPKEPIPTEDGLTHIRVIYSMEAGPHSRGAYNATFRSQFHSMMSSQYFGDPDRMYTPYPRSIAKWFDAPATPFSSKRAHAAIFVHRNCVASSRRHMFVEALMEANVQVDAPGLCLHNIDEPNWDALSSWPFSPKVVMEQYKFGFAIENTLCVGGYTTEKLAAIVNAGVVPIVMSYRDPVTGEQYPAYDELVPSDAHHPPNQSYIDLGTFSSAMEAAAYIHDIESNEEKYNAMLWYKNISAEHREELIASMMRRPALGSGLSTWRTVPDLQHANMCNMARVLLRNDGHSRLDALPKEDCRNEDIHWEEF